MGPVVGPAACLPSLSGRMQPFLRCHISLKVNKKGKGGGDPHLLRAKPDGDPRSYLKVVFWKENKAKQEDLAEGSNLLPGVPRLLATNRIKVWGLFFFYLPVE